MDTNVKLIRAHHNSMHACLRMEYFSCNHWNRVPVNKIFIEQPSIEPRVKVMIPICEEVFILSDK